ncbi:MAG: Clp protease N-terminal domain-containing protein, partial [Thermoanaerobaculia bacterium]
ELSMEEANELGHNYIGTEHLLLGLLRENDGVAAQVLLDERLELEEVRNEVLRILGDEAPPDARRAGAEEVAGLSGVKLPLTNQALATVRRARHEAPRLGHAAVEPEHLLLGLAHEDAGKSARVLARLGLHLGRLFPAVMGESPPGPARLDPAEVSISPAAIAVFDQAAGESMALAHHFIATLHLLLALLKDEGGKPARILAGPGVAPGAVREAVLESMRPRAPAPGARPEWRHDPLQRLLSKLWRWLSGRRWR